MELTPYKILPSKTNKAALPKRECETTGKRKSRPATTMKTSEPKMISLQHKGPATSQLTISVPMVPAMGKRMEILAAAAISNP